jgi:hypothetical protein
MAAPQATHSIGSTPLSADLPFQVGAGEVKVKVVGFTGNDSQKGQADMRGRAGAQLDFRDLGRLREARLRLAVAADIAARLLPEPIGEMLEDALVHVRPAQLGVAAGRLHLEHAFAKLHDGDVERAAAEVDHSDAQILFEAVQPIGQRGRRGSLTKRATSRPAIRHASFVALRWLSSK